VSVENKRDVLAHRAESKLMIIQYTSEVCDILVQWVSAIQKVIIIRIVSKLRVTHRNRHIRSTRVKRDEKIKARKEADYIRFIKLS